MRVLDLFSGIGGLSLGLHWAGMRTIAFCERDPWCRRVLARHWPGVPLYDDVRLLSAERLRADGVAAPDLVCGGFPCQDVSAAGRGGGLDGARSGLRHEMERLVAELRPAGWWLRTALLCASAARTGSAPGWKHWATPAGRSWWALPTPARPTCASASSSWPMVTTQEWWPTPRARDWRTGSLSQQVRRRACPLPDRVGGRLHPRFVEWLMGFPDGWTE